MKICLVGSMHKAVPAKGTDISLESAVHQQVRKQILKALPGMLATA